MQLKKTSKKIGSLINEAGTFSNGYFSFNNIDYIKPKTYGCNYNLNLLKCKNKNKTGKHWYYSKTDFTCKAKQYVKLENTKKS